MSYLKTSDKIALSVLFLAGALLIGFGANHTKRAHEFKQTAVEVGGIVIRMVATDSKPPSFKPVVEYTDLRNERQTHHSEVASSPPDFSVGQKVTLLVSPLDSHGNPEARINAFWYVWGLPTLLLMLGCAFFLIGGMVVLLKRAGIGSGN